MSKSNNQGSSVSCARTKRLLPHLAFLGARTSFHVGLACSRAPSNRDIRVAVSAREGAVEMMGMDTCSGSCKYINAIIHFNI